MLYNFVSDHVVSSPLRDFANEARFAASPIYRFSWKDVDGSFRSERLCFFATSVIRGKYFVSLSAFFGAVFLLLCRASLFNVLIAKRLRDKLVRYHVLIAVS